MINVLKVLVLVIMTTMTTGCIAHYKMDAANFIDITRIESSKSPDAVKVYVGNYRFKGSSGFGNITAQGEISPWLKKGVVDVLKDVSFVDNPRIADIVIVPVEYNYAWAIITSTLLLELNGKQVKLIARHREFEGMGLFLDDVTFNRYMLGLSDLLKRVLENSVTGNHIDLSKVPSEIKGTFRVKGGKFTHMENIKVKQ